MSRLSRRTFLAVFLGGGFAVAAGVAGWSWLRGDASWVVVAIVRRRLGFLGVGGESLDRFAQDYLDSRAEFRGTLTRLAFLALPLRWGSPYDLLSLGHPLRRLEDNVVSQFLQSTDFFENGADETRTPIYLGFHDPARRPCRNPFATRPDGPGRLSLAPETGTAFDPTSRRSRASRLPRSFGS